MFLIFFFNDYKVVIFLVTWGTYLFKMYFFFYQKLSCVNALMLEMINCVKQMEVFEKTYLDFTYCFKKAFDIFLEKGKENNFSGIATFFFLENKTCILQKHIFNFV